MVKKHTAYRAFLQFITLCSAAAPVVLLGRHRQAQQQAKAQGQAPQHWLKSARFHKALHWDLVFCYLLFLVFARREVQAGRAKGPFWLYAAVSTLWGVTPAFPLLLLRHHTLSEKENTT